MEPINAGGGTSLSRRSLLAGAVMASVASACSSRGGAPINAAASDRTLTTAVAVETALGVIRIGVLAGQAPKIAAWFLGQVDAKRFDGTKFYRSGHLQGQPPRPRFVEGGLLSPFLLGESDLKPATAEQAGLPLLYDWETTEQSGLRHVRGAVSLARDITGKGGAVPDLVIALEPIAEMDFGGGFSPQNMGFPVFGHVTAGMEIVEAIAASAREGRTYVPFLNGQILSNPVVIERIVRVATSAGART